MMGNTPFTKITDKLDRRDALDAYAIAAFVGLLSHSPGTPSKVAEAAWCYAEAMILEWEKRR
jgi:hypothetical protein|tara:strand:+ start:149 stop:334 length:186 start_codon:yes stop_codon:yes gene_type:complete